MLNGTVHVLDVSGAKPRTISVNEMGANCLGAPAFYGDAVFIFTKEALFCFGPKASAASIEPSVPVAATKPSTDPITQIQAVPAEFAVIPGETVKFTIWGLDAAGRRVRKLDGETKLEKFIPPTALVKSEVDGTIEGNVLKTTKASKISAGAFKATWNNLSTTTRGRIVAGPGYKENFDAMPLGQKSQFDEDVGFPPLPWLGARVKWHVLEKDGSKVAANRLDVILFQRTMNFIGHPKEKNYTLEADVLTDGTRRIMSTVGLINQRYCIAMTGNSRILEVTSNHERVKESVPFDVKPNVWYHLKTRVDHDKSGPGGVVRAKLWERDQPEPDKWTIEVKQKQIHEEGAPGVFAFSPQSQKRVFIDNLSLTANE
jgi:hypothetical protein